VCFQDFDHRPELIQQAVTDIFKMHAAQQITPAIMKTYPLESFQTALDLFAKKKSIGKIVLTTSRS